MLKLRHRLLPAAAVLALVAVAALVFAWLRDPDAGLTREERWQKYAPWDYQRWQELKAQAAEARTAADWALMRWTNRGRVGPDDVAERQTVAELEAQAAEYEERMDAAARERKVLEPPPDGQRR